MKKILLIVLAVLILTLIFTKGFGGGSQEVSLVGPVDTAGDYYNQWLDALQNPETAEPNLETLATSPILSKALRTKIEDTLGDPEADDPVLCHEPAVDGIALRTVYEREDSAQMLVTSRDKSITNQSVMTLTALKDGWYIEDIECSAGEFAPEAGEFSFEQEGFLLKGSIPAPFDSKNWHLVFEEDGVEGNVVPIFYDTTSQCTDAGGSKATCKPSEFTEATKVFIQGQMTERGVTVKVQTTAK